MAKRSAHEELDRLQKDAANQNVAARAAEDDLRQAHAKVEQAIQELEGAYATENEQLASEARKAVAAAQGEREDRHHRLNARRQRAHQATEAANTFRIEQAHELLAERHNEAMTLAVQLQEAIEKVIALDARWAKHAQQTQTLVAVVPGASPRVDGGPSDHAFTRTIRDLRNVLNEGGEVSAPIPSWQGRASREQQDRTHQLLRLQREGNQTAIEAFRGAA